MRASLLAEVADRFSLGTLVGAPEERHGGVNLLWKAVTGRGAFAVHVLLGVANLVDPERRCQDVHDVEVAAAAAGVRIAPPVADPTSGAPCLLVEDVPGPVVVHEWVEAAPVDLDSAPTSLYERLGDSLARMHGMGLDLSPAPDDVLARSPTADEWRALARGAARAGWGWADGIEAAADELEAALRTVEGWDATAGGRVVYSHRDLTSQNVLDDGGDPVIIDWEDVGPIGVGSEIGRTALDNLGRGGALDEPGLRAFLAGYTAVAPLPPVGPDWCSLWLRGLVVYAEHCVRGCIEATAPPALLLQQSRVVDLTVGELRRRLALVDRLVETFDRAAPRP